MQSRLNKIFYSFCRQQLVEFQLLHLLLFVGDPVGIASANFGLVFSISNRITKKKTKSNEKKKEKETIKFFSSKNWVK